MNSSSQLSSLNRRFAFSCENLDKNTFEVVRFEGEEALSTLYRFEIVLASTDDHIDASRVVNRHASFSLNDGVENGSDTIYRGLVKEFTAEEQQGSWTLYKAILVPVLAHLDAFHLSEVYLDKDKDKVLKLILKNAGIRSDYCDLRMKNEGAEIPKTVYICQYQETYFNFIARWCERLGAYWWFEDVDGMEKAVFSDTWAAHKHEALTLHYQPAGVLDAVVGQMRRVQRLVEKSQGLPKQVTLMDYNPQRAGNPDISASAIVDENGIGEIYLYGENLKNNEDAARFAKLRAEGLRCLGTQYHGSTTATGLRCGHYAEIKGHFRAACNRRFLLTAVRHRGSQSGILLDEPSTDSTQQDDFYIAEFSGIPSDVQFRPLRQYLWPKIEGSMHAFIDAEGSGKYAELNEKGEYKVQVPFDITQKGANRGSAWVRMATPYAGSDHGMHFPLHKGTEVLLSFINGDPDQPVIIGAVPNSMTASPVVNANQSTSRIVTGGGQEISFDDQDGDKYMLMKSNDNCWIRMGQRKPSSLTNPSMSSASSSSASGEGAGSSSTPQMWGAIPSGTYQLNYQIGPIQMGAFGLERTRTSRQTYQSYYPANHQKDNTASDADDNLSIKTGSYDSYVLGHSLSDVNGNRYSNTYGDSYTYIQGKAEREYDDSVNTIYNSYASTSYKGSRHTFTMGNSLDYTLGAKEGIVTGYNGTITIGGVKSELWTPIKNEMGAGFKSELWMGVKTENWGGAKFETGSGAKFQTIAGLNFLTSGVTISQQTSDIQTRGLEVNTNSVGTHVFGTYFGTKAYNMDSVATAIRTEGVVVSSTNTEIHNALSEVKSCNAALLKDNVRILNSTVIIM
jgi:type VI secretion system VgrG family protein